METLARRKRYRLHAPFASRGRRAHTVRCAYVTALSTAATRKKTASESTVTIECRAYRIDLDCRWTGLQ